MKIIGCDFHPSFQQIAMVDSETGEHREERLTREEAVRFYSQLCGPVLVGMEACGNTLWFERLLGELGHELWLGDAGKIRAMEVRKQKTDRRDAELLLQLLLEKRFPRIWVASVGQRDVRQLLLHRHKLVGMNARVLVIVKKQNPQRERNGASAKPKASTPSYALDTAVVVIDEMTSPGTFGPPIDAATDRSSKCSLRDDSRVPREVRRDDRWQRSYRTTGHMTPVGGRRFP